MIPQGKDVFVLTVKGDSMVDAGIFDGDKLVVAKQNTAQNGEIVVALVDDSATVKTFYKEDGHYRLQPQKTNLPASYQIRRQAYPSKTPKRLL